MFKVKLLAAACVVAVGLLLTVRAGAAPVPANLPEPAVKWEYCELHVSTKLVPVKGGGANPNPGATAPAVAARQPIVRLVVGEEEITTTGWQDLADKLKAQAAPKDATDEAQRLRVLNHLGSQGWELVTFQKPDTGVNGVTTWTFKRKVLPK